MSSKRQLDVKALPTIPNGKKKDTHGHRADRALPRPQETRPVQTTFPRLMLLHASQRPQAAALREKVEQLIGPATEGDAAP